MLFGIEPRSSFNFLHDYNAMLIEANINVDGTVHCLNRTKKRNDSLANQQGAVPEAIFGGALTGIGRDDYKNMFSLDDDSLEAGGQIYSG